MAPKPGETKLLGKTALESLVQLAETSKHVVLFCHQNADADSACSAIALVRLLKQFSPGVVAAVVSSEGTSASTRRLLGNLGLPIPQEKAPFDRPGVAVLVDMNNLSQLGPIVSRTIVESSTPIVIVDHHHKHPEMRNRASVEVVDPSSSSTAEIVASLYQVSGQRLDENIAQALLAAIFVETRSFTLANSKTFRISAFLAQSGADPKRIPSLIGSSSTRSERIARLKAGSRLEVEILGDWLIVTSEVGSYQSSAASALLSLGADVSIVAGSVKNQVRGSLRSTDRFYKETGIHLARDVTIPLGSELKGSGGGHSSAAGMTVEGSVQMALRRSIELLKAVLDEKSPSDLKYS